MLFNSLVFIGLFLPITLIGWYGFQKLENPLWARSFLVAASFVFYGYYNPWYVLILAGSLTFNYACSSLFGRLRKQSCLPKLDSEKSGAQKLCAAKIVLFIGLLGNIGLLFYFKYCNFFLENCNFLLHTDWKIEKLALPLGISFFTFQQISYLVDCYKDENISYRFLDYACFITFFPQLIAGPIVLHSEFMPQLLERKNRKMDTALFFDGMALFILGLSKKVLLADVLAIVVNAEYAGVAWLDAPSAWITIICYMWELYFDFSGYCDMARGIGKLFGFALPENFRSPLLADSVKDFWRRWHMTLSRFLTTYIYIPLGGNRHGKWKQCRNILIVFLISGIWHGANWTFVVWGLMHGLAMVAETLFPRLRFPKKWMNQAATGLYVTFTFSIFRSESLKEAWMMITRLFTGGFHGFFVGLCNTLQIPETYLIRKVLEMKFPAWQNPFYIACMVLLMGICVWLFCGKRAEEWIREKGCTRKGILLLAVLFTWSFLSLSQVSTFLYFNF